MASTEKQLRFLAWLDENGAKFPKLLWPSETPTRLRGVTALDDISVKETLLEIPIHLMMRPDLAMKDSIIGPILHSNQDLLRGDLLLTVYIMFELLKGELSFYYPYLSILPVPNSIVLWTDNELDSLQDSNLIFRAKNQRVVLRNAYQKSIYTLQQRYPTVIDSRYTYQLFLFSWFNIQARAFGKRLEWTAMVPFADCLNHSNIQTKYDYNLNQNNLFRLYSSGSNCYRKGDEVFNSYGRRPNDNLLLDYGFSILDNMWEYIVMPVTLMRGTDNYHDKARTLVKLGYRANMNFFLKKDEFPLALIIFLRIATYSKSELLILENKLADLKDGTFPSFDKIVHFILHYTTVSLELNIFESIINFLDEVRCKWSTTESDDEHILVQNVSLKDELVPPITQEDDNVDTMDQSQEEGQSHRAHIAATYRLTRKHILSSQLKFIERVMESLTLQSNSSNAIINLFKMHGYQFIENHNMVNVFDIGVTSTNRVDMKMKTEQDTSPSNNIISSSNEIYTQLNSKEYIATYALFLETLKE